MFGCDSVASDDHIIRIFILYVTLALKFYVNHCICCQVLLCLQCVF